MAIDLTLNYSSGEFLEPKKKQNLGERFNLTETFRRPNAHNVAGFVGKHGITPAVVTTLGYFGITAAFVEKLAKENPTAINKIMAYIGSIPGKLEESDAKTKTAFKEWVSQFGTGFTIWNGFF